MDSCDKEQADGPATLRSAKCLGGDKRLVLLVNLRQEVNGNWLEVLRLNDRLRCDVYCGNIIA